MSYSDISRNESGNPSGRRGALEAAGAELRRLIREGFDHGILGEQLADAARLSVPLSIRSATGGGEPAAHRGHILGTPGRKSRESQ